MSHHKIWLTLQLSGVVIGLLVALSWPGKVGAVNLTADAAQNKLGPHLPPAQSAALAKIESSLLTAAAADDPVDFFVWLTDKADLSPADALETKAEKGRFVFETLRSTAEQSQKALRQELDRQGLRYHPFYIANKILVQGGNQTTLVNLAARPDVAQITANHLYQLEKPRINRAAAPKVAAVESNISFIKADEAWALGFDGHGVVLAGNDTGLDWDHPALINHYRGWNGATVDHNYNWWDATGTYPNAPGDGYGHGTHTTGTMVGSDGASNQIGVAPGSKTVHCKNMDDYGGGNDATFIECFEWDLAPWDLTGANPRPDLAPDAINNSWGYWSGNQPQFEHEITALQAAGIIVEVSAGNEGPSCSTLRSPGDYQQSLTTGSISHLGSAFPGLLTYFSSRGPSLLFPDEFMPDVMAPGEDIRSSVPGGGYEGGWSGTSMAGPHVTGLIGLLWSANPGLRGQVDETIQIILNTSVPLVNQPGFNCGGDYVHGPNNDWGHGTIDALAAVQQALMFGDTGTLAGTITNSASQSPIAQAQVQATLSPTLTWQITSDVSGAYSAIVFSGTYTIDVTKYGFLPAQLDNVTVVSGSTTALDISLDPAQTYTVSGYVTDAVTGWPLPARIDIDGYPGEPLQNDPISGYYSISLAAGTSYLFHVQTDTEGYTPLSRTVELLSGDQSEDFGLLADIVACTAPGYTPAYQFFDNFEAGLSHWTATGLWHQEAETDTCGAQVMPFPSPTQAAYYGLADTCTYADSPPFDGTLTLAAPVSLPASGPARLSFASYEETECNGNCTWDNRIIEISTDGGSSWEPLGEGDTEDVWYRPSFDLTPYLGQDVIPRFHFDSGDDQFNNHLGWLIDDVGVQTGCTPLSGGHIYGYVYDANTNLPLAGVAIAVETVGSTTTDANGFYRLFAPVGAHTVTATPTSSYGSQSQTVTLSENDTIQQDFQLPAGWLSELPANLAATLQLGEQQTMTFPLTNTGDRAASFIFREHPGSMVPLDPSLTSIGFQPTGQPHIRSVEKEAEPEASREANVTVSVSNPDPFGYSYADSNEDAGPSYDWIEIAPLAGGDGIEITQLTGVDEGYVGPATLPFAFNFYGTAYTRLAVASNGTLYFENDYQSYINEPIPSPTYYGVQTFIAPFWDDLIIDPGAVYYQLLASSLIIEFYQVRHYGLPGTITWQVILFENGNILFQYQDVNFDNSYYDQGQSATVGIQGNGTTGLQYSYNEPLLTDELAICFAYPGQPADCPPPDVPWLSVSPDAGALAPGATQDITVTFDASAAQATQPGVYAAELHLKQDTPYQLLPIAVTMTITPSSVTLAPTAETKVGQPGSSVAYTLYLTNSLNLSDTYQLNVSGNSWPVTTPLNGGANLSQLIIGPVAFGQSEPVELFVLIPADAAIGASDTATITVTSQSYPSLSATASLTTINNPNDAASIRQTFLPLIMK